MVSLGLAREKSQEALTTLKHAAHRAMAPRERKHLLLKLLVAVLSLAQLYYLYGFLSARDTQVPLFNKEELRQGGTNLKLSSSALHDMVYSLHDGLSIPFRNLLLGDDGQLLANSKEDNCHLYFQLLYKANANWTFDTFDDSKKYEYDKRVFNRDLFVKDEVNRLRRKKYMVQENLKEKQMKGKPAALWKDIDVSDAEQQDIYAQFEIKFGALGLTEQAMVDAITNLRVFSSCYLSHNKFDLDARAQKETAEARRLAHPKGPTSESGSLTPSADPPAVGAADQTCSSLQKRLLPWLSGEYPVFTRWNGEVVRNGMPIMADFLSNDASQRTRTSPVANRKPSASNCFLTNLMQGFNGRGIVISAEDRHKSDLVNLIRVLRALDNELPIQIIHKGDISPQVQAELTAVARNAFDTSRMPKSFRNMMELHDYAKAQGSSSHKAAVGKSVYTFNFPEQEIWFVDVSKCIKKKYWRYFRWFSNKFLPYLFGSFDDTLLVDGDTVPLVKPSEFFESNDYRQTETLFFRDRDMVRRNHAHDRTFFRKFFPTVLDEVMFGIPLVTNHTLENPYFSNRLTRYHFMESGMVVYRKSAHFNAVLATLSINFWGQTTARVWGDKELFWLGFSIAGDERYAFNGNHAAAVGMLTPSQYREGHLKSQELCSVQPGHISSDDDQTLLWINGGFSFCKKKGTFAAAAKNPKMLMYSGAQSLKDKLGFNENAVKQMYHAAISIQAAIIPPSSMYLNRRHKSKAKDPGQGWEITRVCSSFLWCAYSEVQGGAVPEHRGKLISFSVIDELRFKFLGDFWAGNGVSQVGVTPYTNPFL